MSRWGRGRGGSVAVPLEHLFRENANCPSAARSAGTVGKWGVTSFTSIRTAPYAFGTSSSFRKKPARDRSSPLTVPAVESEAPPPKPKKFFKSRNVPLENAALPTSSVAPSEAERAFPSFSGREERRARPVAYSKRTPRAPDSDDATEKMEIPKLKIHVERSPKGNRSKFFATKAPKRDETPAAGERAHLSPNKRYLVRNRDRVINYAEDRSDSPPAAVPGPPAIPDPVRASPTRTRTPSPPRVKPGLLSPTNKDGKPPIVLRISKGTSRLLSTDSEEILASPTAEAGPPSAAERTVAGDDAAETGAGAVAAAAASPPAPSRSESLKITIKCYAANRSRGDRTNSRSIDAPAEDSDGESSRTARSTRSSRRNRHRERTADDRGEPPSGASPAPGGDDREPRRTVASPPPPGDGGPADVPRALPDATADPTGAPPDVGDPDGRESAIRSPSESPSGRAMRHRPNINYNENANSHVEDVASSRFNRGSAKSYGRKAKRRPEPAPDVAPPGDAVVDDSGSPPADEPPEGGAPAPPPPPPPPLDLESEAAAAKNRRAPELDDVPESADFPSEKCAKFGERQCKNNSDRHVFKSPKRPLGDNGAASADNEDKPSVKLVITKKKGSIFKSRSLVNDGPGAAGKKRHLYRHKWADDGKGGQTPRPEPEINSQVALQEFDDDTTRVTRYQKDKIPSLEDETETYTSVKCPKNAKDYYTVVRNVKKAHQMQEIGEFQEFNDDVEYILDALQDNNPMSTRCLSAITLASKCTAAAFRMHVRAHGTVAKFFRALHDATNDQSLGLCTATVMFVLSQDRLNMDLDRESLELMLNLLESDVSHKHALDDCGLTSTQLSKNKERVRELCAEIKNQDKAKHLDLDNITVGHLAMETLLSLTSKRAGEWFKEELRVLGGVDHILSTICDCCTKIGDYVAEWSPTLLDLLRKADRCMRVLENVTQQNEENQAYLLNWKNGQAVDTLVRLFRLCDREIPLYPTCGNNNNSGGPGATVRDALLPTLKVLINLTHPFKPQSMGSTIVGEQKGIIDASLHLLLQAPNYLPDECDFEFSVCVLMLLINLMQNNSSNIKLLVETKAPADFESVFYCNKPAIQALIDHFYKREELARLAEQNTDAILDGEKVKEGDENEERKNKSHDDIVEDTVTKLLQKAGTHMEHTMIGSYVVILLGHVVMDSSEKEAMVRNMLPKQSFQDMLIVIRKYFNFLSLTANAEAASVAHVKATEKVIKYLDNCDNKNNPNASGNSGNNELLSGYNNESPMNSPPAEKNSFAGYSNMDISNNSNTMEYTSESDKMSSSIEMDTSFN